MKKQKVQAKINLETLAGGAFAEKLNEALMQVAENIQNPNTEATTKRQITVNIKFTPNKTRQMVGTQIAVTTKLAATEAIDTQMVMGVNMRTGQIEIAEYDGQIRGQMDLSDFTDVDQDPEPEETQAAAPTPGCWLSVTVRLCSRSTPCCRSLNTAANMIRRASSWPCSHVSRKQTTAKPSPLWRAIS